LEKQGRLEEANAIRDKLTAREALERKAKEEAPKAVAVRGDIDEILEKLDDIESNVPDLSDIEEKLDALEEKLENIESGMDALSTAIEELKDMMSKE